MNLLHSKHNTLDKSDENLIIITTTSTEENVISKKWKGKEILKVAWISEKEPKKILPSSYSNKFIQELIGKKHKIFLR